MNIADYRRWSWTMVVVAAALVIGVAPSLYANQTRARRSLSHAPAASGELKNVAVIARRSLREADQRHHVSGYARGQAGSGPDDRGAFCVLHAGQRPGAIDKKQAWGVIVQTDGAQLPAGRLPARSKPDDLLDVAKGFGAEVKDGENGAKEVVLPNKKSIFVKVDERHGVHQHFGGFARQSCRRIRSRC